MIEQNYSPIHNHHHLSHENSIHHLDYDDLHQSNNAM